LSENLPGPRETPDLLRRYLEQPPYEELRDEAYVAVMEEAVQLWPESRFAHAGLGRAILRGHRERTIAEKRRAASAFVSAAEIAFAEGKVRYVLDIADVLGDLQDRDGLNRYLTRALAMTRSEHERYGLYSRIGRALSKAGDDSAEIYLRKAIETQPTGTWESYELYGTFLLEHGRARDVLDLFSPELEARQIVPPAYLLAMRCNALQKLGRADEARSECDRARTAAPPAIPCFENTPGGRTIPRPPGGDK
jgi:tetratricopeptide (TPR) repeat protein